MKVCPKCTHENPPELDSCEECGADISLVASDGQDPLIDEVLVGKFHIKELIGQGAMGRVYRAVQKPINRDVAIKILHQHLMEDQRVARRFQREAEAASRFTHPNSIAIFDFGQTENKSLYIAMEYIIGPDLAEVISQASPIPAERVIKIGSQVLSALQLAHNSKIIHRDLKPENIMLSQISGQDELVKVCDFGIAKIQQPENTKGESALTMFGMICGTPYYMSPEQAKGEELDGRTDLYSMGVILYEMLTGEVPFRGSTPVEVIARHLTDHAELPSKVRPDAQIPRALEDVVMRALRKNRDERFASAEEFRIALEKAREETAFHMELERVLQTSEQDAQRRPTNMSIPVATVAAAGTVVRPSSAIAGASSLAPSSSSTSVPQVTIARGRAPQPTPHPMPATTPPPASVPTRIGPAPSAPNVPSPHISNSISAITQARGQAPAHHSGIRPAVIPSTPPPSSMNHLERPMPTGSHGAFPVSGIRPAPLVSQVSPHHTNFDDVSEPVVQRKGGGRWIFLLLLLAAGVAGGYYLYTRSNQTDPKIIAPELEERPLAPLPRTKPSVSPIPRIVPRVIPSEPRRPSPRRRRWKKRYASNGNGQRVELQDLRQQLDSITAWMDNNGIHKDYLDRRTWRIYQKAKRALWKKNVRSLRRFLDRLSNKKVGQEGYIGKSILDKKYSFLNKLYEDRKKRNLLTSAQSQRCEIVFTQIIVNNLVLRNPMKANTLLNQVQGFLRRR
ncbi:MAG: protein kinase [Myxococcales bacterium]|nr:protein kinase [Myxococcales bacterium]